MIPTNFKEICIRNFGTLHFVIEKNKELRLISSDPIPSHKKEINIPDTIEGMRVTKLSISCLKGLGLRKVVLPKYLTKLSGGCLSNNNIEEIHLPEHLTEVNGSALSGNPLIKITVNEDNEILKDINGKGVYRGDTLVLGTQVGEIAEGTRIIGKMSFAGLDLKNKKIRLPDTVIEIEERAFFNPTEVSGSSLENVMLPEGLETIGEDAFRENDLINIKFPTTLRRIGKRAFANNKIKEVKIPDSVVEIGERAFLNNHIGYLKLGSGLKKIKESVFKSNSLQRLEIPKNIEEIGENSFAFNQIFALSMKNPNTKLQRLSFCFNKIKQLEVPYRVGLLKETELPFYRNPIKKLIVKKLPSKSLERYVDLENLDAIFLAKNVEKDKVELYSDLKAKIIVGLENEMLDNLLKISRVFGS